MPIAEKRDVAVSRWVGGKGGSEGLGGSWMAVWEWEIWAWMVGRARRMWSSCSGVGMLAFVDWEGDGVGERREEREVVERPAITLITSFPFSVLSLGGGRWKAEAMEGELRRREVTWEGSTARRITLECWIASAMEGVERAMDSFPVAMCAAKRVLRRDSDAAEEIQAV